MLTALIKKNERAFTLIELPIVIATLGVLAAIFTPQFFPTGPGHSIHPPGLT